MTISKSLTLSIFVSLNLLANTNSTAQNTNSKTSKKKSKLHHLHRMENILMTRWMNI